MRGGSGRELGEVEWVKNNRTLGVGVDRGVSEAAVTLLSVGSVTPGRAGSGTPFMLVSRCSCRSRAHPEVPVRASGGHQGEKRPPGRAKRTKLY